MARSIRKFSTTLVGLFQASLLGLIPPAAAGEARVQLRGVALELVLAIDTSASVDLYEYDLQMSGLAAAFRNPVVQAAIRAVGADGIAVALVQWGVGLQQRLAVDWAWVGDPASAERLARRIEASPRHFVGNGTAIGSALRFSIKQLDANAFAGRRRTIDIAADGRSNAGSHPTAISKAPRPRASPSTPWRSRTATGAWAPTWQPT